MPTTRREAEAAMQNMMHEPDGKHGKHRDNEGQGGN